MVMTASLLQTNIYAYYLYILQILYVLYGIHKNKYLMIESDGSAVKTTLATVCP